MDSKKDIPVHTRKRKYIPKILNSADIMGDAIITEMPIAAKAQVDYNSTEASLSLKQPIVRRYRSRNQKPITTSKTSVPAIKQEACDYKVISYRVMHNEQIGNYNVQTLEPANLNHFEDIPVVTVSDACLNEAVSENGDTIRDIMENEIPQELRPTEAMHVVSSAARMNELMYKLEFFLQANEKSECNDPEYAFGRSVGLMLKSIDNVANRLKIKAKIYNFLSEELQHI